MIIPKEQLACDHSFGEDGSSMFCVKCKIDRDIARLVGKAIHRADIRSKMEKPNP